MKIGIVKGDKFFGLTTESGVPRIVANHNLSEGVLEITNLPDTFCQLPGNDDDSPSGGALKQAA